VNRRKVLRMRTVQATTVCILMLCFVTSVAVGQILPEPLLVYSQLPKYPPLAIETRIQGSVKLTFFLNEEGGVSDVQVVSGHPLLNAAATDLVKTWRFQKPSNLYRSEWRYETEIVYRFSGHEVDGNVRPTQTVSLATFRRMEVTTDVIKPIVQY
jgi:TonB family protein